MHLARLVSAAVIITATFSLCIMPLVVRCDELQTDNLLIESCRPLNEALNKVQEDLHVAINYEEAPVKAREFLVKGGEIGLNPGLLYPRMQTLSVTFVAHESNPYSAIQTLLAAYESAGLPGKYKAHQNTNSIDVMPIEVAIPLSDRPIAVPAKSRTYADTLQAIADQMSAVSGIHVAVLNQPFKMKEVMWFSANKEPALLALKRLNQDKGDISFRLIYDPADGTYYLNLAVVQTPEENLHPNLPKSPQQQNHFFVKTK